MRNDYYVRGTWQYKLKMWFYRLTLQDIRRGARGVGIFCLDFMLAILALAIILLMPHLFH